MSDPVNSRPEYDQAVLAIYEAIPEAPSVYDYLDALLAYPRLRELLEEAGRIEQEPFADSGWYFVGSETRETPQ